MINYETILSLFDDKLTLLEYLTKIEKALKDSTLTEITIEQPTETTAVFTFVFENGDTIVTPSVTLPRGEKGDTGDKGDKGDKGDTGATGADGADGADGVSVTGAEINVNNHLILTLSNSNTIDAGLVSSFKVINIGTFNYVAPTFAGTSLGTYTPTQSELNEIFNDNYYCLLKFTLQISENVSEAHYLYKTVNDPTTSTIKYNSIIRALNLQTNEYFISIDNTVSAKTLGVKIPAVMARNVYAQGATAGQVLTADGSNGASWQNAGGGGSGKYMHVICLEQYESSFPSIDFITQISFFIINDVASAYTSGTALRTAVTNYLQNVGNFIQASGRCSQMTSSKYGIVYGIYYNSGESAVKILASQPAYSQASTTPYEFYFYGDGLTRKLTDTVISL